MARPHADKDDGLLHVRLVNWGRWSGWRPWSDLREGSPGGTVDDLDAQEMERAMVAIKRSRKPLYRVLFVRYVTRRDDIMGADRLRMSVTTYQERMQRAFNWLHGFFERDRGP